MAHTLDRFHTKCLNLSLELQGGSALDCQTQISNSEFIPLAGARPAVCHFEQHWSFSKATKNARRGSMPSAGGDLLLLAFYYAQQVSPGGTETQLSIEPECARLDCLVVVQSYLIRVYRKAAGARQMV